MKAVSALVDTDPVPGSPDGDELEIPGILIERYESEHFPVEGTESERATSAATLGPGVPAVTNRVTAKTASADSATTNLVSGDVRNV
ncbi:hypothetical protein [Burkholderia cepacia]|uniref:hypothetical protein n=1 Tax=Burkholderia cepacia TaxID=292 RepID=UPI000AF090A3